MVHVSAVLFESEFVFESIAGIYGFLSEARHTIHAVREKDAVPVNGGRGRQLVGDVDADAVAFNGLDGGSVDLAVEPPAIGDKAGSEFVIGDLLCDQVIDFDAINDFPWQRAAVGGDDGVVVFTGLGGRQVLGR